MPVHYSGLRPDRLCQSPVIVTMSDNASAHGHRHADIIAIDLKPLAETTIYEMEQRGEFPKRFRLTVRCVVWDLEEVEAWIEERKQASRAAKSSTPVGPDVRQRLYRPVK